MKKGFTKIAGIATAIFIAAGALTGCGAQEAPAPTEPETVVAEETEKVIEDSNDVKEASNEEILEAQPTDSGVEVKELVIPDGYTKKPLRIIVPVAAGGTFDMAARKVAELAGTLYGIDAVVENLPGGSGVIGMTEVVNSGADGHTIALYSSGFYGNVSMGRFDGFTLDMFEPVNRVQTEDVFICVGANSDIKNFDDFAAAVKAGGVSIGGSGALNNLHIGIRQLSEVLTEEGNYDAITWTSEDGGSRIAADLLGDSIITAGLLNSGELIGPYESGEIIPILCLGQKRVDIFPDAPTLSEVGYENLDVFSGFYNSSVIYAPTGIAEEDRQLIFDLVNNILLSDEFQEFAASIYATSEPFSQEELAGILKGVSAYYINAKETYLNGLL